VLSLAPAALFSKEHYQALNKPDRFYYGYISYVEAKGDGKDPTVLREGQAEPIQAVVNLPLGPGDVIRTTWDRRCEIQFDTATIVRLDVDTELKIETILARSLSSSQELSNLFLTKGRIYVMYKEYGSREMFQVLTPATAVKLKHKSVVMIKASVDRSTDVQVKYGKANCLFGKSEAELGHETIGKAERLIVTSDGQSQVADYIGDTDFEVWNDEINREFEELHEGAAVLPKPIQKLPRAVFHFAQQYGTRYGEWVWDAFYGYVWRPFLNDGRYPSGGWQPYYHGQWGDYAGQMFWIPDEPWGWVPYHLGIWQWNKKYGWVWLPGSLFAPAWVDWDFFFGNFCWRPWTLWDWYWGGGTYVDSYYGPYGFDYWAGDWHYQWPGALPPDGEYRPPLNEIRKGQLRRPGSDAFPLPSELKGVLKKVVAAYEKGDRWAVDSMANVPSQLVFIRDKDLGAPRVGEKALKWDAVPRLKGIPPAEKGDAVARTTVDPSRRAVHVLRGFVGGAEVREMTRPDPVGSPSPKVSVFPVGVGGRREAKPPDESIARSEPRRAESSVADRNPGRMATPRGARFLDWNPDVRIASRLGVSIEYSSRNNEVRSPELRISSSDRFSRFQPLLTSDGVSSSGLSGGNGGAGSGSAAAPGRAASGQEAASRGESSKAGGGKEAVKK
jgi:hypothetical protein